MGFAHTLHTNHNYKLDKNQLYVNLSEIEDAEFGVSDDDKDLNEKLYGNS